MFSETIRILFIGALCELLSRTEASRRYGIARPPMERLLSSRQEKKKKKKKRSRTDRESELYAPRKKEKEKAIVGIPVVPSTIVPVPSSCSSNPVDNPSYLL